MSASERDQSPRVLGLGTATPPHAVTQAQVASLAALLGGFTRHQARALHALYRRAQVQSRGSMLFSPGPGDGIAQDFFTAAASAQDRGPGTRERLERYAAEAPALAWPAAVRALRAAGLRPGRVTHLVTVSCTGFSAPGVDIRLMKLLGLAPTVERTHVGFMGCHGAINGLRVAGALAAGDPQARVLVCAVELCSLHLRYGWHDDGMVANALFADGAAAAVIGGASAPLPPGALRLRGTGSCLMPDSEDAMGWTIGDHGFEMRLQSSVPGLVRRHLRPWLEDWLARAGLTIPQVGSWAIHPGGPRVLRSVVEGLGLAPDADLVSRRVLAAHGNMSSPTVLFILQRLRRQQARLPYVALAFGPGLVAEAALIDAGTRADNRTHAAARRAGRQLHPAAQSAGALGQRLDPA